MNKIDQLKDTNKWKAFEIWYEQWRKLYSKNFHTFNISVFENYCFDIQRGVFEKYLEFIGFNVEKQLFNIHHNERILMTESQILNKRYTEAWFLRTVASVHDEYVTICSNPVDHRGNSIPFDSFEELLIWFFKD